MLEDRLFIAIMMPMKKHSTIYRAIEPKDQFKSAS